MYPSAFDYVAVSSWDEAVAALAAHADEDPRVIAGGQSLVPMMNLRLAEPSHLIDINGVAAEEIRREGSELVIPALTRHAMLERSEFVIRECPMLAHAASLIGNARIRHRGTLGGSLAHADPSAELPCAVVSLGARVVTIGPAGSRTIPIDDFFEGFFTTALEPNELIREVRLDAAPPRSGWGFEELVRRASDFAVVEVAAVVELDVDPGVCRRAELVAGGVSERPVRLEAASRSLPGEITDASIDAAGAIASESVAPPSSEYASSDYRRHLTGVLVRRAVRAAVVRARKQGSG